VATSEGEYVKLSRAPPFRVSRNTEAWDFVSMILALFYFWWKNKLWMLVVNKYLAYYASG
jgi:hypothetical protein